MISGRAAGLLAASVAALLLSLASSCSMTAVDDRASEEEGELVEVPMEVAIGGGRDASVKGRFSGSETGIGNCFVAAFRTSDGVLMDSGYSESGQVVLKLLKGTSYDFYAVANCGDISSGFPSGITETSVTGLRIQFPDPVSYAYGLPAAGKLQSVSVEGSGSLSIQVVRLVSKWTVAFEDPDNEYEVASVRIVQAASDCTPFSPATSKAVAAGDGDSASESDLAVLNAGTGGSVDLYVPVNMRGNVLQNVYDSRLKSLEDVSPEERLLCTYLEVIATSPGGDVTYRNLLGNDSGGTFCNCDIRANENCHMNVVARRNDIIDSGMRWTQGGAFDGVIVKIAAGGTVSVRFNDDNSQIVSKTNTTDSDRWFRILSPQPVSCLRGAFAANRAGCESNKTDLLAVAYIPTTPYRDWLKGMDYSYGLFRNCAALKTVSCANWHTESVKAFMNMFYGCNSLQTPDVSKWDTSSLTSMNGMFYDCRSMVEGPDLSAWDDSLLRDMYTTFMLCLSMETPPDFTGWDTPALTNLYHAFHSCRAMKTAPVVSNWNTSAVTDMRFMFDDCRSMATVPDVSGWNTGSVTNMDSLFGDCWQMPSAPDVSGWNTSRVSVMARCFSQCRAMTDVPDVSRWDTSAAVNMEGMFDGCWLMPSAPDVSGWNTSSCTSFMKMFGECRSMATTPDVSAWGRSPSSTSAVRNLAQMFVNCWAMPEVPDFSSWSISGVSSLTRMFLNCENIEGVLDFSGWDTSAAGDWAYFLYHCRKVHSVKGVMDMSGATAATEAFAFGTRISLGDNLVNDVQIIGFGKQPTITGTVPGHAGNISGPFSNCAWGVASPYADAARSKAILGAFMDSLFDRSAAGYATIELRLVSVAYASLTSAQISAAEAKGYQVISI